MEKEVNIKVGKGEIFGNLYIPQGAKALIIFVHGSGSSRFSPRNKFVADFLSRKGFATLLFDLFSKDEEKIDDLTGEYRFDINFLVRRLEQVMKWVSKNSEIKNLKIGLFGSSTGAAAALVCASKGRKVFSVVSRGGRPDMAMDYLGNVKVPVLLIVGGEDKKVIELNKLAFDKLKSSRKIEIVPGATHLFEEPGKLEKVAELAANWFLKNL